MSPRSSAAPGAGFDGAGQRRRSGHELQVDVVAWARCSTRRRAESGRARVDLHGVLSRHCSVWVSRCQATESVMAGCERAWAFVAGVFGTLVSYNLSAVVGGADTLVASVQPGVRRARTDPLVQARPRPGALADKREPRRAAGRSAKDTPLRTKHPRRQASRHRSFEQYAVTSQLIRTGA
jgi:hypothetical protein